MATHIVTGAAGFIGSHLVDTLLARGDRVVGIDQFNPYYDPALKRRNLEAVAEHPNFELLEANIRDLDWSQLLDGVEVVFHQAAQAGVRASWGSGFFDYTTRNLNATQIILEAAKDRPTLQRIVYASSSSIYGDALTLPTPETTCPQPVSPYGITKLAGEQLGWLYHRNYGVPVTALRYFTVYGPRQRPDMAFHKFFKAALAGDAIPVYGDGQQTRDYTFVSDAIAANLAAAAIPEAIGTPFNVGGGTRTVLEDVLATMEAIVGHPIRRDYQDRARGDARHTAADTTRARTLLGYLPQVSLAEGLEREWHWVRSLYASHLPAS